MKLMGSSSFDILFLTRCFSMAVSRTNSTLTVMTPSGALPKDGDVQERSPGCVGLSREKLRIVLSGVRNCIIYFSF